MFRPLRHWPAAFHEFRSSQAGPPRRPRRRPARRCPPLEQLEGRLVLSAYHVSTLADAGPGSLREAVARANTHPGADVVVFDEGLTGTIALTGGELDLTDDVKINGPGADELTVSGSHLSRVFKVEAGEAVSVSGLTIAGGNAGGGNGGGIDNFGELTVSDSVFSDNAAVSGGGLANESGGTATVRGSIFTANSAIVSGGGLDSTGTATVRDSTFTANSAGLSGGGLANSFETATVSDSTFTGNSAAVEGGGLANGGPVTVRGSTFS